MSRTTIRTALGVALALAAVAAPAHAELSSAADPSWVTNGEVKAATRIDQTVYVGGTFDYVGPFTGNGVVLDTGSGTRQSGWPTVEGGQVLAAVPDGSGGWFIGGDFDKVGGQSRLNIAHVRGDQTIDPSWNPGTNNTVRALVVSAGYLYIGGDFSTVAGLTRTRLAALSVTTGVPRNDWTPTASAAVRTMAMATVSGTTYVVIAGSFTTVNSTSHRRLARIRASDGASDDGWLPGILDDSVNALAIAGSTVYVAGSFDEFDDPNSSTNLTRHGLGSFDLSTGAPTAWTVDVGGGFVNALLHDGSRLYAGGGFTSIGGESVAGLAAIDLGTGAVDTGWTPDPQVSLGFPNVYALALHGTNLVVGGSFTSIGGELRDDLAIVSRSGSGAAISGFAPNVMRDENTEVTALAVNGSDLYVGGDFRSVGGVDRGYLAAFSVDDGTATSWNPVADGPVEALAKRGTSTLYVGGSFSTIAGQAHANLAALNTSGALLPSAVPAVNGAVYGMVVDDTAAQLVIGGAFTTIETEQHARLAAIDLASGHVLPWAPSVDGAVIAIALTSTRAYIGGNFTTVGVSARPNLAAVNRTTGVADSWNPQPNGRVAAIQVEGAGPVFAGGDFTTLGGSVTRTNLAAIDQVTGAPTTWRSDATGGAVHALWLRDTALYVGGEFTSIDGTARNRLAAVEVSDGDALPWNPNVTGTSAVVEEIEVVPGSFTSGEVKPGKVYIGGRFTQIGLLPRGGYAGFNETTDPPSNTVLPAITGTAQPGSTVNCTNGTWTGSPTSFTRQWRRGATVIAGQTGSSYAVQVSDVGAQLICAVTASNVGGAVSVDSAAKTVQAAPDPGGGGGGGGGSSAPTILSIPTVNGAARAGSTLTCSDGVWNGTPAPTFGRVWRVAGVDRGTTISFTPEDGDAGKAVSCTVTATNASGSAQATSTSLTIAPRPPAALSAPSLGGDAVVGSTLTCTDGTWTGSPTLTRTWLRSGSPVSGATASSYAVTGNDVGRTLRCRVTASNGSGSADSDSNEVTVTAPAPPATPSKPRKPAIASAAVRLRSGAVSVRITCYAACRGTVTLANGRTRLGSARLLRAKAGVAVVRVPLTKAARTLVARRGSLRVQVVATLVGGGSVARAITIRK